MIHLSERTTWLLAAAALAGTTAGAEEAGFLSRLSDYIENTRVFESGQEPGRAFHVPEAHLSLNGPWRFFYSDVPEGVPNGFFREDFDDGDWDRIAVPSNWEMQGYGDKLFRNISTSFSVGRPADAPARTFGREPDPSEFTVVPPAVPAEYNPTGAYRKSFDLPGAWHGQDVFLRFERVASASFVWVNGEEVGYNEGAHEPAEYDVTPYLREGVNTVAVFVVKFSDGYYLEDQDYWRLAGIFGDVTVFAKPKVRLADWGVTTDLDAEYRHARLSIDVEVAGSDTGARDHRVAATLARNGSAISTWTSDAFQAAGRERRSVTIAGRVENPAKWTAETPHLYDLRLELLDGADAVVDRVDTRIGFKETAIADGVFLLNGVPVKLHAINSHMQHPVLGHVVDEETIRRDLEILKRFNFNAVRTSHYPPVHRYVELADEYGLYIIDEVGDEAHATQYLSEMPEYLPMYLERVQKLVLRDRNRPSVLFWSAGNESGEGENISRVIEEGKRLDPTRYWMYGGNAAVHPAEDIVGPRYPTPVELEMNFGLGRVDTRPSFMDEYLSVAGNGGGGLDDYWRAIETHPRSLGGAIWDFVSPGVTETARRLEDRSPFATPAHVMGRAALVGGRRGRGISLNGHDQWVEVYRAENLEIAGDELTLSMDVRPRSLHASGGSFVTKGSNQFGLRQVGRSQLEFYLFNGERQSLLSELPADWEGKWHHLMAVYDGASMRILIDGEETASRAASGDIRNLPYPVNVGRDAEAHGQETDVYISDAVFDDVAIFARALEPGEPASPGDAALWLDFERETAEGAFFSYGIGARTYGAIWPDRTPQPEMWQMKKSAQPLSFRLLSAETGEVEVWNRSSFTAASHWETRWALSADEEVLQSGTLHLDVAPRTRALARVPYARPEAVAGREYRLTLSTVLRQDEVWADAGFEVAWEQFEVSDWGEPAPPVPAAGGKATLSEDAGDWVVSGEGFVHRFDRESGALVSLRFGGREMLVAPLKLSVWRAPIANELDPWVGFGFGRTLQWKEGYGQTLATEYYSKGIHDLKHVPLEVRAWQSGDEVSVYVREHALVDGGREVLTRRDLYIRGRTLTGFESVFEYRVRGDGSIVVDHRVLPQGTMPQMLPRIGLTLMLDPAYDQIEWHGRGPQENYPDRKTGYRVGVYRSALEEMYEPYLLPQDHGLRTDVRWLRVTDEDGTGLRFAMDEQFNFNAYPFTTDNLTKALYTFQLRRSEGVTLNLDYDTNGVGGTARPVLNGYRVYPREYSRRLAIRSVSR